MVMGDFSRNSRSAAMKTILLTLTAVAMVLLTANAAVEAGDTASKTATPDWHYRWHEGRWWYWMPQGNWMVWTGSIWIPYEGSSGIAATSATRPIQPGTASFAGYETEKTDSGTSPPASSGEGYCPPTYSGSSGYSGYSGYSSSPGMGSNYSGYGWTWGPGTAYSNSPGRRF
jgi:hypothetical protein